MKNTRNKSNVVAILMRMLPVTLVAVMVLILAVSVPAVWADRQYCDEDLDEAEVFIEWNSTDGDRGIQFFWDGEPWKSMIVKNESGREVLDVVAQKNVRAQGLTEGFFESAEPTEDELSEEEFLTRFPEGDYTFIGRTLDGCWLVGETELTHELPTPVVLNLKKYPTIKWEGGPDVVGYEVVVELVVVEDGVVEDGDERVYVNTATFPGDVNKFKVSSEFLDLIKNAENSEDLEVEELKVEVIAIEESGNKTITEEEVEREEE